MRLYHYTNPDGAQGIEYDELIKVTPGNSKFAWFGEGVYLTSMPPSAGRKALLWNNHRKNSTKDANLRAKTSMFFSFESANLPKVEKMSLKDGRDVYICRKAININKIPYRSGCTDDFTQTAHRPQQVDYYTDTSSDSDSDSDFDDYYYRYC